VGGGGHIQSISKEINNAEHEYMNMPPPPIIELATPLGGGVVFHIGSNIGHNINQRILSCNTISN
jgi:hypothetical protein